MESLAESLEFEAMLYQWIYIIFLIITVIVIVKTLIQRSEYESFANQYQNLLNKYNADVLQYFMYETGIEGVPENSLAYIFADAFSVGIKLVDNEFDKIIRLDYDNINWLGGLLHNQWLDIDLKLPRISVNRIIFSYQDSLTNSEKYIVLNYGIPEGTNDYKLNQYIRSSFDNTSKDLIDYLVVLKRIPDCPSYLIHPIYENDENTINL